MGRRMVPHRWHFLWCIGYVGRRFIHIRVDEWLHTISSRNFVLAFSCFLRTSSYVSLACNIFGIGTLYVPPKPTTNSTNIMAPVSIFYEQFLKALLVWLNGFGSLPRFKESGLFCRTLYSKLCSLFWASRTLLAWWEAHALQCLPDVALLLHHFTLVRAIKRECLMEGAYCSSGLFGDSLFSPHVVQNEMPWRWRCSPCKTCTIFNDWDHFTCTVSNRDYKGFLHFSYISLVIGSTYSANLVNLNGVTWF